MTAEIQRRVVARGTSRCLPGRCARFLAVVGSLAAAVTTLRAQDLPEKKDASQIAVVLLGRDFPRNPFTPRGGLAGCRFGNAFGHTAIALTGRGVFGKGNHIAPGTDLTAYVADNTRERDITIYIINATPTRATEIEAYFRAKPSGSEWKRNCATAVAGALQAAGYDLKKHWGWLGDSHLPGSVASAAEALAKASGGCKVQVEKGAVPPLEELRSFDRDTAFVAGH